MSRFSKSVRFRVLQKSAFRCVYCGGSDRLEIDHVHPRSHGGGDDEHNLVAACFECNRGKRDQVGVEVSAGSASGKSISFEQIAYCGDGCAECPVGMLVLPRAVIEQSSDSIRLGYECACGHRWLCWWSLDLARSQHTGTVADVMAGNFIPRGERTFASKWMAPSMHRAEGAPL